MIEQDARKEDFGLGAMQCEACLASHQPLGQEVTEDQGRGKKAFHHSDFSNLLTDFWGNRIISKRHQDFLDALNSRLYLHLF